MLNNTLMAMYYVLMACMTPVMIILLCNPNLTDAGVYGIGLGLLGAAVGTCMGLTGAMYGRAAT